MCTVYDFLLQLHNCYRYVSRWRLEMVGFARAHTHTQYQHNNFQRQYHSVLGIILFCFSFHSKIHTMNYLLLIFIQFSSSAFIRLQCVLYIWCVAVLPLLRLIVTLCNGMRTKCWESSKKSFVPYIVYMCIVSLWKLRMKRWRCERWQ